MLDLGDAPVVLICEPGRTALHIALVEPLVVGRSGSGLLVDDPQVSRQHVELKPAHGGVTIRDLGSTHGTSIDGRDVDGVEVLTLGAVVKLGNTTIELAESGRAAKKVPTPIPARSSIERVADSISHGAAVQVAKRSPDRTLTIVFSDIEGSTEKALALGDARWFEVLSAHNQLLRHSVEKFGGTEIKSQGDGFMLTFESARNAIDALIEIQRRLDAAKEPEALADIRVRAGAHLGEAIVDDDGDLFGRHVNIAARVAAQAAGGEILVSPIVREIAEARGDLRFGEPRSVSLKGISEAYLVHPVEWC